MFRVYRVWGTMDTTMTLNDPASYGFNPNSVMSGI